MKQCNDDLIFGFIFIIKYSHYPILSPPPGKFWKHIYGTLSLQYHLRSVHFSLEKLFLFNIVVRGRTHVFQMLR